MVEFYIVYIAPDKDIRIATVEATNKREARKSFNKVWPEKVFIQFNKK